MITRKYLATRTSYAIVTAIIALIINFLLPRLVPGNPVYTILLTKYHYLPPNQIKLLESQFGLQNPSLWYQFQRYIIELFHGNLGISYYYYPSTVVNVIATHLPWTLYLLGTSTAISSLIGVIVGKYIGWHSGTRKETFVSALFMGLTSIPFFWIAVIFQLVFALYLTNLLPISGAFSVTLVPSFTAAFILSVIKHSILPIFTLVLVSFPGFSLTMRNTMVNQNREDYLTLAKAKGIPERLIVKNYAARNAVLPVATHIVLAFGYVVAGAFFVEVVFSYPGIGDALYVAVTSLDYPLVDGIFLMITLTVIIANFISDILYAYLDPRVELR
ncbi:MAG: ABC transporter permease [Candidatus Thermoplasmatota archaeon]|nr:ABC transporter permease [Candidatus Thermoplasmatota archaeon]